ncbi:MAG: DUF4159 domain-containing protein [Verrucomicrobia bacterium]|nr:DUF4159 domain-containing protein [Verrucomicrobiota bacterium]
MRAHPQRWFGRPLIWLVAGLVAGGTVLAQRGRGGGGGGYGGGGQIYVPPGTKTAREIGSRSTGTPMWENPEGFRSDVFTMARLRYDTAARPNYEWRGFRGAWSTDLPDEDLNISWRLALALTEGEVAGLRAYLQNGGFMLMTDFWGDEAMAHVERMFAAILPGSHFEELPIEHPLYRCVFNIREKAQVPNIRIGLKVPGSKIHHRVIFDAKGRIMVMGLHNSDDSDGWEREGEDVEYFKTLWFDGPLDRPVVGNAGDARHRPGPGGRADDSHRQCG